MGSYDPIKTRVLLGVATVIAASADVSAQRALPPNLGPVLYEWTSATPNVFTDYGKSYAGIGDVDGDGVPDVAVGAVRTTTNGMTWAGRVYVACQRLIVVAAIVVAASGLVQAQGPRPPLLHEWTSLQPTVYVGFGRSYTGIGDVDGDGATDVAVGAPATTTNGVLFAGRVYVFSGRSGSLLWTIDGTIVGGGFGTGVAAAGDLDRDGCMDLLVHARDPGAAVIHRVHLVCSRSCIEPGHRETGQR